MKRKRKLNKYEKDFLSKKKANMNLYYGFKHKPTGFDFLRTPTTMQEDVCK